MKQLVKRKKTHPEDFSLVDLIYIPNTIYDWIILGLIFLVFVTVVTFVKEVDTYNRELIVGAVKSSETKTLKAINNIGSAAFLRYLSGTWVDKKSGENWNIIFQSLKSGTIVINNKYIPITIIDNEPPLGVLKFYSSDKTKTGKIERIWNMEAIIIKMPDGSVHTLLYSPADNSPGHGFD